MNLNVLLKPTLEQVFLCVVVGDADQIGDDDDDQIVGGVGDDIDADK